MGHLMHSYSYVYFRNNKVLGVSLVASYKGNPTTLLLHTLASDQLIIPDVQSQKYSLSDLTGARKLASIATYFQLGKPVPQET